MSIKLEIISSGKGIMKHRDDIASLVTSVPWPSFFLLPEYIASCIDAFDRNENNCMVFLAWDEDELVGYLPFLRGKINNPGVIENKVCVFSLGDMLGYSGVVVKNDVRGVFDAVFSVLASIGIEMAFIGPVHESSLEYYDDLVAKSQRKSMILKNEGGAPYVSCYVNRQSYLSNMPKGAHKDALRCLRKLSNLGQVRVAKFPNNGSDDLLSSLIDRFIVMYNKQWGATSRFLKDDRYRNFYYEVARSFRDQGVLELSFLLLGDRPVATSYGFVFGGRYYYFTPTYDVEFSVYSPGKILLNHIIGECFDNELVFDFMNDVDPYKLSWCTDVANRHWVVLE